MLAIHKLFERRRKRVRFKIQEKKGEGRLRLSVFRSSQHIYAQIIDDRAQKTLVSASTVEKDLRASLKTGSNCQAAEVIGKRVAERALASGIKAVVFDRGGYLFHGRVKAVAEAARAAGLSF